jgi:4-hydroxy-tetrahydrodipicolinate reductase
MTDSSQPRTRVVCVGLGAIGQAALDECLRRDDLQVVAAVDPVRAGETVGGVVVVDSIDALGDVEADVAIVATGSYVPDVARDAAKLLERGLGVVSSCEALVYPWLHHAEAAAELDAVARKHDRAVAGTGVNPGFIMDVAPVFALSVCIAPRAIRVTRNVDLSRRRPQLPAKLGVGCTAEEWQRRADGPGLGHAGLEESAALCAVGAGWPVGSVRFEREPVLVDGSAVGIREVAEVDAGEGRSVSLELVFRMDGEDVDRIEVEAEAGMTMTLEGVHGDRATVARLVQAASVVRAVPAGLRLPIELPGWSGAPAGAPVAA